MSLSHIYVSVQFIRYRLLYGVWNVVKKIGLKSEKSYLKRARFVFGLVFLTFFTRGFSLFMFFSKIADDLILTVTGWDSFYLRSWKSLKTEWVSVIWAMHTQSRKWFMALDETIVSNIKTALFGVKFVWEGRLEQFMTVRASIYKWFLSSVHSVIKRRQISNTPRADYSKAHATNQTQRKSISVVWNQIFLFGK